MGVDWVSIITRNTQLAAIDSATEAETRQRYVVSRRPKACWKHGVFNCRKCQAITSAPVVVPQPSGTELVAMLASGVISAEDVPPPAFVPAMPKSVVLEQPVMAPCHHCGKSVEVVELLPDKFGRWFCGEECKRAASPFADVQPRLWVRPAAATA